VTQARASAFGELDIWLARAGRHEELYAKLGAHVVDGGVRFAVWASNANEVSVVGDFNGWHSGVDRLQPVDSSGFWEGIVDGAEAGQRYKFDIGGALVEKADPMAFEAELPPRLRPWSRGPNTSGRTTTGSTRAAVVSRSRVRSRSTRCMRRRGGRGSAGASSRNSLLPT
jgi:1,4-alpha-glucan branching enzyme